MISGEEFWTVGHGPGSWGAQTLLVFISGHSVGLSDTVLGAQGPRVFISGHIRCNFQETSLGGGGLKFSGGGVNIFLRDGEV